jgi:site-specific DNA recombinase
MRVALYARFSSDLQRQTSIADQLRAARARAAAEAWPVVIERSDEGVSGATPFALRPGGKALLADALANRFDVLILEGLDRAFRDLGEQEQIVKRLEHRGVRIIGTSDGYDTSAKGRKVMRVARGLVNEIYLDDLREKTHRGLAGQFDRGLHVGGVCLGYRSQPSGDGRGRELVIDPERAAIVLRIFQEFADGSSARNIVHRLNADGVPSPRGGTWAVSALVGDSKRGAGVLNNELYVGRLVWNRRQWLKDPETGRRCYVDRPRNEWQTRDVPDLRIVPEPLWNAVRTRTRNGPARGTRTGRGASPKTLFAGLLRCPTCEGPIVAIDARRYGCSRHNDRGAAACRNTAAYPRKAVEAALLGVVRADLLSPAAVAEAHAAIRELLSSRATSPREMRTRQDALQREIERLVDAVAQLGMSDALRARLTSAEGKLAELRSQTTAQAQVPTADQVFAAYRRQLLALREALETESDRDRTRTLLAEMLGPVVLTRDDEGAWAEMEEPAERIALTGSSPMGVVAGARFELATFGL